MEICYVHGLEDLTFKDMNSSPNWSIDLVTIPIKIPTDFFLVELDNLILKYICKSKGQK